ncbi:MAG TPA: CsgG/HfaB family protein [Verrucomicrobiae bacterium]|nr:CsgG/HfaB family protein [Verrucomicrobiae bacterium]
MNPKIASTFVLLCVATTIFAQVPKPVTVAVYDFTCPDKDTTGNYGNKVTALVTADLTAEPDLVMLERAEVNKALQEQAFGDSGMVSSDVAAKIGQITGVKVLIAGQVFEVGENHVVIVADIIGTETARLYTAKVEGAPNELMNLTSKLAQKISQTISQQSTNLVAPTEKSHADRLERLVKGIKGKNRPTVSVKITQYNHYGTRWPDSVAENEFGAILLKAGFKVVDDNSNQKPDMEISGDATTTWGEANTQRGGLLSIRASIALKVQERKTGTIITLDHQESAATGIGETVVDRMSQVNAVDDLAGRILPLLAK